MRDYEAPVAYRYASPEFNVNATYHPKCLIEEMVDRRELSPAAAWDMAPEDVLNQHAGASGILREDGLVTEGPYSPQAFPQSQWPSNELAERPDGGAVTCGRCETPILPMHPPVTEVQHVARDLAANDWGMDRNDYDPQWCAEAEAAFGPQATQHVVANKALRDFRQREQISDWALAGAQATEALNRPRVPDDIDALRARLAAPGKTTRIGPKQTT